MPVYSPTSRSDIPNPAGRTLGTDPIGPHAPTHAMQSPIERLRASIGSVYLGNGEAVDRIICCLVARGHVLIEDVPGVGKTVLASAVARSMNLSLIHI
mgnify:CR=1 FL=1